MTRIEEIRGHAFITERDQKIADDLLKAVEDARPVMELLSKESCKYCDDVTMVCAHVQARAWLKEYFPEVKK